MTNSSQDETEAEVTPKQRVAAGPMKRGAFCETKPSRWRARGRIVAAWQPKAWDNSRRARRAQRGDGTGGWPARNSNVRLKTDVRVAGWRELVCQAES